MQQVYICYPNGKFKALTMSYDDGRTFDRRLVDIFNRNGIKGTFHLNGGLMPDEEDGERIPAGEVKSLYEGHEVASHTYTHPTIERCPLDTVALEVLEDRKKLEGLVGYPIQGLSYPNGSMSPEIAQLLPSLGIEYSRTVGSKHNFGLPKDWMHWQATCHHNQRLLEHGDEFVGLFKKQYLYLMYVWGHSFEFDRDDNWGLMEEFCEKVGSKDDIWYCTNIEFKRYMTAAHSVVFSMDQKTAYNPSNLVICYRIDDHYLEIQPGMNTL